MPTGTLLDADPSGKPVDQKVYRRMIGSLLYLTASRPDIMFATCFCERYQSNPKESYFNVIKRILRYLKGIPNLGLWYLKDSRFDLTAITNVDHTQLRDFGYNYKRVPIYCDSKSAIAITANPVQQSKTKHIDVRYHFIKDHVEKGDIEMHFVQTDFQLDDLFTKSLDEKRFQFLISKLGMLNMSS
ncbi:hypothetical protein L6452_22148 [Arctium lappa]|uniref:Uncharacterized protein n=1 Tax=Arctium lappa TaxID=4217 RepID=A0ACB9AZS6_ARCLA|nr:hypothetical protein L6452_22148 [Arctium lappa]